MWNFGFWGVVVLPLQYLKLIIYMNLLVNLLFQSLNLNRIIFFLLGLEFFSLNLILLIKVISSGFFVELSLFYMTVVALDSCLGLSLLIMNSRHLVSLQKKFF